jgi:hypothetical protein
VKSFLQYGISRKGTGRPPQTQDLHLQAFMMAECTAFACKHCSHCTHIRDHFHNHS